MGEAAGSCGSPRSPQGQLMVLNYDEELYIAWFTDVVKVRGSERYAKLSFDCLKDWCDRNL